MTDKERLTQLIANLPTDMTPDELAHVLLVRGVYPLPCKLGGSVFAIEHCITAEDFGKLYISRHTVDEIRLNTTGRWSIMTGFSILKDSQLGVDFFLTRKEAENRLRELTGGKS